MRLTPIQVESAVAAEEDGIPARLWESGQCVEVEELIDRWYQLDSWPEWPKADYFKVRGNNGRHYLLKHDVESGDWYLGKAW